MSGGSPRVVVPDRRHVAAWVAGDAAVHGEVSRYADSSDEDGEWDSICGGGVAACMIDAEGLEAEDLEDENFSFFDAGGLHCAGWNATDDRSLRSIGQATGATKSDAPAPTSVAVPELAAAPEPAVTSIQKSESTPSGAAVAAAAARVRVAAASKLGTVTQIDSSSTAQRRQNAPTRGSKDLEERERRARAAEARLREQAEQQAKERAQLAAVHAKAARLRAAQQEQVHQTPIAAAEVPAAASAGARRGGSDDGRQGDALPTASTPPRPQIAAKHGPSRPPPDSPLRTSMLESKFLELQQAVRATPPRKQSFAAARRHQPSVPAKPERPANVMLSASLEFERQVTAEAKEAWREASAEEAVCAQELQQVRAAIKAAEAAGSKNEAVSERFKSSPQPAATPVTRYEAGQAGVKWSDVGTPAEVLEKKLRKYRAKMNSPELTAAKRNEYLAKIRHYSAKAAELEFDSGSPAGRSRASWTGGSGVAVPRGAPPSAAGDAIDDEGASSVSRRAGQGCSHSVRAQRSAREVDGEESGWKIGDRCHAGALLGVGTVRFVGQCLELAKVSGAGTALWAGVELDLPRGKHDG